MLQNPSPGSGANRACRPCTAGDVLCWNGPQCKRHSVGTSWFQHRQEESESVVEQRQVPNDIPTGQPRVTCLLEDMLLHMRNAVPSKQRYQSQARDKRDSQHATEDESAKPTWEVMVTTPPALSVHSCDAEPNTSPETLGTPEGGNAHAG